MAEKPTAEDVALWQRRLASQANNRAWTLAEMVHRSPEEDEEMLQAAHAAMYFWKIVGKPNNHAHAANVAFAEGDAGAHARHYSEAKAAATHMTDAETQAMFTATLCVVPTPRP